MNIPNRKVSATYYIVECPMCARRYIWVRADLKKRLRSCKCGYVAPPSDFDYEEEQVTLLITEDGIKVIDD
jgi:hypothetical protein